MYIYPLTSDHTDLFNAQFAAICQDKQPEPDQLWVDGHALNVPFALYYVSGDDDVRFFLF